MTALSGGKGEKVIALVLRYGALISTIVMALGLCLALLEGSAGSLASYQRLQPALLFSRLVRLEPAALTEVGVLLLLSTPIVRVVAAAVSFGLEREYKYVLVSLGVLTVVLLSIGFALR